MNETRELAHFVAGLKYEDLPLEVVSKTEELILDQLGVQVSSSIQPWCQSVYRQVRDLNSRGGSSILNYGDRVAPELAAFANGTFGHGFEMDDTYIHAHCHPGCVVVAAAVAMGESELVSGRELILATVAGYEVMGQVGISVAPSLINRGHNGTASLGPFGAAAVAGKILRFDTERMLQSLSIAASLGSGIQEFWRTGGSIKRIYGGLGAQGGIRAALLAQQGLTGPPTALEGQDGFCRVFSDGCRLEKITDGLGQRWVVPEIVFKRYHTDYNLQAPLDAFIKLLKEHDLKPGDVAEIVVGTNELSLKAIGIRQPPDVSAAHFSAPFCLGMALVRGHVSFKDFVPESLTDPAILAVAERVKIEVDDEMQAVYPGKRGARVRVRLINGAVLEEKVKDVRGTAANPMSRGEVEDKFRSLASIVLPEAKVEAVIKLVRELPALRDMHRLCRLLVN